VCTPVNIPHHSYLVVLFTLVVLIDTDLVNPEQENISAKVVACPKDCDCIERLCQALRHREVMAVQQDIELICVGAPSIRQCNVLFCPNLGSRDQSMLALAAEVDL
jgi:hypothetical protein